MHYLESTSNDTFHAYDAITVVLLQLTLCVLRRQLQSSGCLNKQQKYIINIDSIGFLDTMYETGNHCSANQVYLILVVYPKQYLLKSAQATVMTTQSNTRTTICTACIRAGFCHYILLLCVDIQIYNCCSFEEKQCLITTQVQA